jgi:hypothetical protein
MRWQISRRRFLGLAMVGVAALGALRVPPSRAGDDPVAFAQSLYKLKNYWRDAAGSRAARRKYLTIDLAGLVVANYAKKSPDSALDYDPLVQAQDFEIKNLAFAVESQTDKTANIRAAFVNFDQKTTLVLNLALTDKGWRLADIHNSNGESLVEELRRLNAAS